MALIELPLSSNGRRYEEERIGSGRYATVYRARDEQGKTVAIKYPHECSANARAKLRLETAILERTDSPYFIKHVDHNLKTPYLVMEYVPATLQTLIATQAVDQEMIRAYISQIPEVLRFLIEYKISHCDLKPDNIGYSEGQIKVLDFGLAIPFERSTLRKITGNNTYGPPEFKNGMVLPSSDTYSAGKTLETLLVGHHSDSVPETLTTIELYHNLEQLPKEIRDLISGMISPKHTRRKNPEQLAVLAQKVATLLQQKKLFNFEGFGVLKFPEM
jgi:serine/threonine protein kinase